MRPVGRHSWWGGRARKEFFIVLLLGCAVVPLPVPALAGPGASNVFVREVRTPGVRAPAARPAPSGEVTNSVARRSAARAVAGGAPSFLPVASTPPRRAVRSAVARPSLVTSPPERRRAAGALPRGTSV